MFRYLSVASVSLGFAITAQAQNVIPMGNAGELALHRIERLVSLKKIDEAFESRFKSLIVENIATPIPGAPAAAKFKVTVFQYAELDNSKSKMALYLDGNGKSLSNEILDGGLAEVAPLWPEKDPISIAEASVHFLEDNAARVAELAPYLSTMKTLTLSQQVLDDGKIVAALDIQALNTDKTLRVFVGTDGVYQSYVILPAQL